MSGGGGGMLGPAMAKFGNQTPSQGVAQYTPAQTRATYNPAFSSQQTAQAAPQPAIQGLPQQMRPQAPQNTQGLQGLMSQMMSRYQNPSQMQQRAPMPMTMPQYRNTALSYRPDMANAQQNLSRVAPSVAEQQRLQAIEDARIAAEQPPQDNNYYNYGG
jgi:CxxC motif-containing protein (DUF1111 family)